MFGLVVGWLVWWVTPGLLPWMVPVLIGPLLSIPLSMLLGSVQVGEWLARWKLLLIPEEVHPPAILHWQQAMPATATSATRDLNLFVSVLDDPAFYALHVGILRATDTHESASDEHVQQVWQALMDGVTEQVPAEIRRAVLNDATAMERLHVRLRSHDKLARSVLAA